MDTTKKSPGKYEMDMCSGPLLRKLIIYSLPLMATGILQLLFNAVDLIVVGRLRGSDALAAVGATTSLVIMLTNLFFGISIGANVIVARFYASGDRQKLEKAVHTVMVTGVICGILAMMIGAPLSQQALHWMGTPDDILEQSSLYLKIYYCGMPFFLTYNFGSAILRGIGDTRRPLYFLTAAGIANVGFNILLVAGFGLGVEGVAIGTVISQLLSCLLVVITLLRTDGPYKVVPKKLRVEGDLLVLMLRIGVPAGLQGMLINFSNVLIQSSVNSFGNDAMAGYAAASNLNAFLFMAVNAITQSCLSFVSQNYGARNLRRADRVVLTCGGMDLVVGSAMGILFCIFGEQLLSIYAEKPEVIACGMQNIMVICAPYALCGIMDMLPGAMRGLGYSTVPMFITLTGVCLFRVFWIYVVFPAHRSLTNLFLSFPVSWILTIIMQAACLFIVRKHIWKKEAETGLDL